MAKSPGYIQDRGLRGIKYIGKDLTLDSKSFFKPQSPYILEHFLKTLVAGEWLATETGVGAGKATFASLTTAHGGHAVGVAGATTNNGEEISSTNIGWLVSSGPIVFETRAKFVGTITATDGDFYLGLADAGTYTNSLPYVLSAASAFTTSAPSDFAGFGYSSIPTSGNAFVTTTNEVGIVTSKATVDTYTRPTDGVAAGDRGIKDSLFHTYTVVIDALGNAQFYRDHQSVGGVGLAVATTAVLTPYINVVAKNSHAHTATVDYIYVAGAGV